MALRTGEIMHLQVSVLKPNPYQPESRLVVKEETAREFGQSILEKGLLQVPVCRMVDRGNGVVEFQMVDGWLRRSGFAWLTAHGHPEYAVMPVTLREFTDQQMADMIIVANQERKDLTPIDLAWYYKTYLAEFKSVTQMKLAESLKVSQGEIANTIRLLELPEEVQQMIITQEITPTHGRSLLQLKEHALMTEYARKALENQWTVAALDGVVKTYLDARKPKLIEEPPPAPPVIAEAQTGAATEEESEEQTETEDTGTNGEDTDAKAKAAEGKNKKPVIKAEPVKPAASRPISTGPAPAAAKPAAWKRKLVLEETANGVSVSVMAEGKFPVMKGFIGNLEIVVAQLAEFLAETNAKWEGK